MSTHGYVPHYRMLLAGLGLDAIETDQASTSVDATFLDFLLREFARLLPFDPDFYAANYPDVLAAQTRGQVTDLQEHFVQYGFREGRLPHALLFDAEHYGRYADLAGLRGDGGRAALTQHFQTSGRFEGRVGHADLEADAARWTAAIKSTPYRLASRSIDSAYVQAFRHPLAAGPPEGFRGGLVLGGGATDLRLRHRRGTLAVDSFPPSDAPVGVLSGEYVYGGPYYDHFGHAMAEMIHRVLPARTLFDCERLLFVGTGIHHATVGFEALPTVMQAPLLFLGVDPADVTVIHDDRIIQRLHVVQQGSDLNAGPTAPYLNLLAGYTPDRLNALHDGAPAAERLYVSRSRVPYGGVLLGERYLEKLLVAEGWTVLHPQELPLVDQMQAYHRARVVMFGEGSACHGVELFGTEGLDHCLLLPRRHNHRGIFENTLRPRARRYDTLPSARLLGSVVADPETGAPSDHMGVSAIDLPGLARALRTLGLAKLPTLDPPSYRRAAQADLEAYIAYHVDAGTRMIDAESRARFQTDCAKALR